MPWIRKKKKKEIDLLLKNIDQLATMAGPCPRTGPQAGDPEIITDGAVGIRKGKIVFVGKTDEALKTIDGIDDCETVMCKGHCVIPAFVDCHTHAAFVKWRVDEFEQKLRGKPYLDILREGGGILSTIRSCRSASKEDLNEIIEYHLHQMFYSGSMAIEVKTGYGLSVESELKMLNIINEIAEFVPPTVISTFLGAHAIPPEFANNADGYIDLVINEMLPAVKGKTRYCDVFIEEGAFNLKQGERVLRAAKEHGLGLKAHVGEFNDLGGAEMAAEMGAVSVEHLDHVSENGMKALAKAGTIAVLMPGVNLFLGTQPFAPARKLIETGVPVALATDFNPGSCPCYSMPQIIAYACMCLKMTPAEALAAATINAAKAIGLEAETGSIEVGKKANLLFLSVPDYRLIPYNFGHHKLISGILMEGEVHSSMDDLLFEDDFDFADDFDDF